MSAAYRRTLIVVWGVVVPLAALVELLAYVTGFKLFVAITWTVIDGSIAVPLLTFALGMLLGHFSLPRFPGWRRRVAIGCYLVAAAVLYPSDPASSTTYLPGSAAAAGMAMGALFFVADDRRRR